MQTLIQLSPLCPTLPVLLCGRQDERPLLSSNFISDLFLTIDPFTPSEAHSDIEKEKDSESRIRQTVETERSRIKRRFWFWILHVFRLSLQVRLCAQSLWMQGPSNTVRANERSLDVVPGRFLTSCSGCMISPSLRPKTSAWTPPRAALLGTSRIICNLISSLLFTALLLPPGRPREAAPYSRL